MDYGSTVGSRQTVMRGKHSVSLLNHVSLYTTH